MTLDEFDLCMAGNHKSSIVKLIKFLFFQRKAWIILFFCNASLDICCFFVTLYVVVATIACRIAPALQAST
jgi:hypothetical protein